jgi:hypothetical protein
VEQSFCRKCLVFSDGGDVSAMSVENVTTVKVGLITTILAPLLIVAPSGIAIHFVLCLGAFSDRSGMNCLICLICLVLLRPPCPLRSTLSPLRDPRSLLVKFTSLPPLIAGSDSCCLFWRCGP